MSKHITLPEDQIADFCQRHRIRKLALFGSVLREDFGPESDIDVLVEFEPDAKGISFFGFMTMQIELSKILGREVDLHTPGSLSRYFRQKVLEAAEVHYERK
jgi:hypothetical protein